MMAMILNAGKSPKLAALLGTLLVTTSCSALDIFHEKEEPPQTSQVVEEEEGQLLRYCKRLHRKSDLVVAAGMCQRAHEVDPSDSEPLLELGVILNKLGQRQQAVQAYRQVLKLDPGNAEATYGLGKTYIGLGQYDLALNQFNALFSDGEHDPRIYNAAGVSQGLKGDHKSAQALFLTGLEHSPNDIKLRNNLGLAYVNNGELAKGIAYLEATAQLPIADATTKRNLQVAYSKAQAGGNVAQSRQNLDSLPQHAELGVTPVQAEIQPSVSETPSLAQAQAGNTGNARIGGYLAAEIEGGKVPAKPVQIAAREEANMATSGFQSAAISEAETVQPMAPEKPKVAEAEPASASGGKYAVQLAAFRKKEVAQSSWKNMKAKAPDLLGDVEPVVLRADLGAEKGVYFRLRTVPMARQDAETLCGNLQAREMDCMVVRSPSTSASNG